MGNPPKTEEPGSTKPEPKSDMNPMGGTPPSDAKTPPKNMDPMMGVPAADKPEPKNADPMPMDGAKSGTQEQPMPGGMEQPNPADGAGKPKPMPNTDPGPEKPEPKPMAAARRTDPEIEAERGRHRQAAVRPAARRTPSPDPRTCEDPMGNGKRTQADALGHGHARPECERTKPDASSRRGRSRAGEGTR